jgi:hypothetical protein
MRENQKPLHCVQLLKPRHSVHCRISVIYPFPTRHSLTPHCTITNLYHHQYVPSPICTITNLYRHQSVQSPICTITNMYHHQSVHLPLPPRFLSNRYPAHDLRRSLHSHRTQIHFKNKYSLKTFGLLEKPGRFWRPKP